MNDSILTSIKKLLGITEDYEQFDADLVMHINSVFMILNQIGVGPKEGFSIVGKDEQWSDFMISGISMESVKTYVYMKVRLMFDPPLSSVVMECMNRQISELEWRLNVECDKSSQEVTYSEQ